MPTADALSSVEGILGMLFIASTSVRVDRTRLFHISRLWAAVHRLAIDAPARLITASASVSTWTQLACEPYGSHCTSFGRRGVRVRTVVVWPSFLSHLTSAEPRNPVPPAMTTFMAGEMVLDAARPL